MILKQAKNNSNNAIIRPDLPAWCVFAKVLLKQWSENEMYQFF